MVLALLGCPSPDCPAANVPHKLWQWLENDAEQQVAAWHHYLVFDPHNTVMAQTQLVSWNSLTAQDLSKTRGERHQRRAIQRAIVRLHDLLVRVWCLMIHLPVRLRQRKKKKQKKHKSIHRRTARVPGSHFICCSKSHVVVLFPLNWTRRLFLSSTSSASHSATHIISFSNILEKVDLSSPILIL